MAANGWGWVGGWGTGELEWENLKRGTNKPEADKYEISEWRWDRGTGERKWDRGIGERGDDE